MAAPGADASDSTPVPRRGWRPSRATVGWVATSLAMLWALVGYRIQVAHEYAQGLRLYPIPASGDHLYSMPKSVGWLHKGPGPAGAGS